MPQFPTLRAYRKHYSLTQGELADLLCVSQTRISRLEDNPDAGALETAFALEVLFALSPRQTFRRLYREIEELIMARAAQLDRMVRGRSDPSSRRKQLLLQDMVARVEPAEAL